MVRNRKLFIVLCLTVLALTGYSCSLPVFNRGMDGASVSDKSGSAIPARLSGAISLGESCTLGYYRVKLTGLFEGGNNQVETQSDQTGRFSIVAPPGRYLVQVAKDGCGAMQSIDLEENTEHMISVSVSETKPMERASADLSGRLPASVLILPKR